MKSDDFELLAHRLGYAGLIPFMGLALLMWLVGLELHPYVATALLCYGAVVASFLGGIHWGIAFSQADRLGARAGRHLWWSVALSLLAWVAVMMPAYAGLPTLGMVFVLSYLVDRRWWPEVGLSYWLMLRFRLTALATLSCLFGAAAT